MSEYEIVALLAFVASAVTGAAGYGFSSLTVIDLYLLSAYFSKRKQQTAASSKA